MTLYICPGVHDRNLTEDFCQTLQISDAVVLPTDTHPPYSPAHVLDFARQTGVTAPCFLAFSAGVVGAMGAAWIWRQMGHPVTALIALDGWGVPLFGDFPIHRLSHDETTHRESSWLGAGGDRFYADPAVAHLDLWRSPHRARGWFVRADNAKSHRTDAASFIRELLRHYRQDV